MLGACNERRSNGDCRTAMRRAVVADILNAGLLLMNSGSSNSRVNAFDELPDHTRGDLDGYFETVIWAPCTTTTIITSNE